MSAQCSGAQSQVRHPVLCQARRLSMIRVFAPLPPHQIKDAERGNLTATMRRWLIVFLSKIHRSLLTRQVWCVLFEKLREIVNLQHCGVLAHV